MSHPLGSNGVMDPSIERALAERAASQLGLFTRKQATAAGVGPGVYARRRAAGLWPIVGNQVICPADVAFDGERRLMAACLDVAGVASHRTAAWRHGLDGFRPPDRWEVLVPRSRTAVTPLARVHRTTNLPADDVLLLGGIPTTSVARTFLDLAKLVLHGELLRERLLTAVESAIRDRKASDRWLWWLLEERRCRGRDGVSVMESILRERSDMGPTESWLEREALRLFAAGGLPTPRIQRRISHRGAFVSRVDFAFEPERVVVEVEGKKHLTEAQQSVDARQRNEVQLLGYVILTFNHRDVVGTPGRVLDTVRRALLVRSAA